MKFVFLRLFQISMRKFESEILSEIMNMLLWQPCCQDLLPLKCLEKTSFCANYFYFGNARSGSWQNNFPAKFLFFINHRCYSNRFNQNQRLLISIKTSVNIFWFPKIHLTFVYTCCRFLYQHTITPTKDMVVCVKY